MALGLYGAAIEGKKRVTHGQQAVLMLSADP